MRAKNMISAGRSVFDFLRDSVSAFIDHDCPRMAAALAYYTVFALPPLLLIVIRIASVVLGRDAARGEIESQLDSLIGHAGAASVEGMIRSGDASGGGGVVGTVLGAIALVFGATTAFAELQSALNAAWEVRPESKGLGIRQFFLKRVLSLGMVLGVAFLLLVSLALSTFLSAAGAWVARLLPEGAVRMAWAVLDVALSFGLVTLRFATIFKVMPDAKIRWRDVWVGALMTSLLFNVGKFAIGLYLGQSDLGSTFGTAGSFAVLLVWIYYSSMVVLLGAEMTQVWARQHGRRIGPESGAVRVERGSSKKRAPVTA